MDRGRAAIATLSFFLPSPQFAPPASPGGSLTAPRVLRPPPGPVCQNVQGVAARRADLGEDGHPGREDADQ